MSLAPTLLGTISAMHSLGTPESQSHSGNVVALVLILMSAVLPYGWLRSGGGSRHDTHRRSLERQPCSPLCALLLAALASPAILITREPMVVDLADVTANVKSVRPWIEAERRPWTLLVRLRS